MRIVVDARTDVGMVRDRNEDCVVVGASILQATRGRLQDIGSSPPLVIAVLDGMGGHARGALASRTAAQAAVDATLHRAQGQMVDPVALVNNSNQAVHAEMVRSGADGMGTTFVGLIIEEQAARVVNAGDSSAYRVEDDYLIEQTSPHRGMNGGLTTCLGGTTTLVEVDADVTTLRTLEPGARFLLCSDGLTDVVAPAHVEEILVTERSGVADRLIAAALEEGAPDNVTVVVVDVFGDVEG